MASTPPTSREEFKQYCLRALGYPVITIEVSEEQLQDRIDDALLKYQDYHFDGSEHVYYKIHVTASDIANQYFSIPTDFVGITRIFRIGNAPNVSNLFNIRYQIHLNDLFDYSAASFTPYVMAMRHIETLEEIFVGEVPIRFNRHNNKLYCDFDWAQDVIEGQWIVADGYRIVDPETNTGVWQDQWLKKYAVALIKRQWGINISKFSGMNLPAGVMIDGTRIVAEANEEIKELDADVINSYSPLVIDMTG